MSKITITLSGDTMDELKTLARQIANDAASAPIQATPTMAQTVTAPAPTPVNTTLAPMQQPMNMAAPANTAADGDDDGPVNSTAPAFDSAGVPWDERIHSGTKGQNTDGTWKRRRNTHDATYNAVMSELRARAAGSQPTVAPAPVMATPVQAAPAPQPAAAPVMAAPTPMAPAEEGMGFGVFMQKLSGALQAKKFDEATLQGWLGQWGLANIGQLNADPIKTKQFHDWLSGAGIF